MNTETSLPLVAALVAGWALRRRIAALRRIDRNPLGSAAGYGVPGLTLDGTDPEAIASAFAWAGFGVAGQLSTSPQTPSASMSSSASFGQASQASPAPSASLSA